METPGTYYTNAPKKKKKQEAKELVLEYMRKCYAPAGEEALASCIERVGRILSELDEVRRRHELEHLLDGRSNEELYEIQEMIRRKLGS